MAQIYNNNKKMSPKKQTCAITNKPAVSREPRRNRVQRLLLFFNFYIFFIFPSIRFDAQPPRGRGRIWHPLSFTVHRVKPETNSRLMPDPKKLNALRPLSDRYETRLYCAGTLWETLPRQTVGLNLTPLGSKGREFHQRALLSSPPPPPPPSCKMCLCSAFISSRRVFFSVSTRVQLRRGGLKRTLCVWLQTRVCFPKRPATEHLQGGTRAGPASGKRKGRNAGPGRRSPPSK